MPLLLPLRESGSEQTLAHQMPNTKFAHLSCSTPFLCCLWLDLQVNQPDLSSNWPAFKIQNRHTRAGAQPWAGREEKSRLRTWTYLIRTSFRFESWAQRALACSVNDLGTLDFGTKHLQPDVLSQRPFSKNICVCHYNIFYCIILYYIILYYSKVNYIILSYIKLYYVILYYITWYYIILYYSLLYYNIIILFYYFNL